MSGEVHCIEHPLIQHKLSLMRRKSCSTSNFRALLQEIAMLLGYEVTRDLPLEHREIETPLMKMRAPFIAGKKVVLISVLRAGAGLLDGMTKILPAARVGHVGLYRDPQTLEAVEYYFRAPSDMSERQVIVVDPMLATGNSAAAAVTRVKDAGARSIKFACLLSAPEGISTFHQTHPDVPVFTAAIDERLNEKGYILPGLGDAGDRLFGTR